MKIPLKITLEDITHSDAIEAAIREKAGRLDRFYPHIMSCRVSVRLAGKHSHQRRPYNVHIDLTVPGGEIAVNHDMHEDIYVAIRDAFDAARRKLEDYGRVQRGDNKAHEPVYHGRVARMFPDEGYGFIETSDGRELYFSRENLVNAQLDELEPGTEVQFLEQVGAEGLQAKRVSVGKHSVGP